MRNRVPRSLRDAWQYLGYKRENQGRTRPWTSITQGQRTSLSFGARMLVTHYLSAFRKHKTNWLGLEKDCKLACNSFSVRVLYYCHRFDAYLWLILVSLTGAFTKSFKQTKPGQNVKLQNASTTQQSQKKASSVEDNSGDTLISTPSPADRGEVVSSEELIERSDKLLHQGQLEEALELANAAAESLPSDGSQQFRCRQHCAWWLSSYYGCRSCLPPSSKHQTATWRKCHGTYDGQWLR